MELFPSEVRAPLPPLYSQELNEDPLIVVKFFGIFNLGAWTWYAYEGSPVDADGVMIALGDASKAAVDFLFFGLVASYGEQELGYFSLNELQSAKRGDLPLVERDLYWKPQPLSCVQKT